MRTILKYIPLLVLVFIFSCKKDGQQYDLHNGTFTANTLTASSTDLALNSSTENDTAVVFTWSAADYGKQPVVGYTLQLEKAADTADAWSSSKTYDVGVNGYRFGFITKELNALMNTLGLDAGVATPIAIRIKADVKQFNGAASTVASTYSNTLVVNVTTYATRLYIPGDYQGWNPGAAPEMYAIPGRTGMYERYVYMAGAGQHYFKYTNAPDWNHVNYGDGGNGTFTTDGLAGGLSVADGGYIYLTADLGANKWTATKVEWGIIGDATPGSWDNDTEMSYDPTTEVWTVTANMKKNGSFKFRANKQWALDFGIDGTGALIYADNPFLGYTAGLNNLTVPEDGNYTITLDLHVGGVYNYTLHKN